MRGVSEATLLLLVGFVLGAALTAPPVFEPADVVCSGKDDALNALRGKHLIACDLLWPPYFMVDEPDDQRSFRGLDVDLLTELSRLLQFNFTISLRPSDVVCRGNETWSSWLQREIKTCDIMMSWWHKSRERWKMALYVMALYVMALYLSHNYFGHNCFSCNSRNYSSHGY